MSPVIESAPPSTMSPKTLWGSPPAPASANWRIGLGYARVPLRCTVRVRPVGSVQVAVTVTTPVASTSAEALETYVPLASVSGVSSRVLGGALRVRVIGGRVERVDAGGLGLRAVEGLDVQGIAPRQTRFDRAHLEERDAEQGHDHHDREAHEERRAPLVAERGLREAATRAWCRHQQFRPLHVRLMLNAMTFTPSRSPSLSRIAKARSTWVGGPRDRHGRHPEARGAGGNAGRASRVGRGGLPQERDGLEATREQIATRGAAVLAERPVSARVVTHVSGRRSHPQRVGVAIAGVDAESTARTSAACSISR